MTQPGDVNRDALAAAQAALEQLDVSIEEGRHGDVEGLAETEVGLDALAAALAGLFEFPAAKGATGPDIREVLAYLVSLELADDALLAAAHTLVFGIKRARYEPLQPQDLARMESARDALHDAIGTMLHAIEEAPVDG